MKKVFSNFFQGFFNIFLFLPHFFSIPTLFRTLFSPWKNLVAKKTARGFSFNEWFGRISFNGISAGIGFLMRITIILSFLFIEVFLILLFPFITAAFVIISPLIYLLSKLQKSEEEKKAELKQKFISTHLLDKNNLQRVENWFENEYNYNIQRVKWWDLKNLLAVSPLARDWAVGYTPNLDKYVEELTSVEYQKKVKHAVGRVKEIKEIEEVLSKSEETNVLLVGEEGVGKQTIVDTLAKRIYEGKSNAILNYKRILKLNLEAILAEKTDSSQRENLIENLLSEAHEANNTILVIDNFERYASSGQGHIDLSSSIEKFAKRSTLQIIAITTPFAYEKFVFPNTKISQLFTKIEVAEISKEEAEEILLDLTNVFEDRYHLTIPYETVKNIIEKSEFYITHIPFPEKAIELLDTSCSRVFQSRKHVVHPDDIDSIVSQVTHAPVQLDEKTKRMLIDFEKILSSRIIAQPEAIKQLSASLRRSFVLLGKRKKPLSSFLFLGPTGVGKTETAKALGQIFFGDEKHLIRFDMSLYQTKEDIPNLIGSQQTQNPGLLTQGIRDHPYSVLLLDEIEKAHKDLLNIFLTVLDEGYFTDGLGKKVDCKNLIIVATSNAGSDFIFKQIVDKKENFSTDIVQFLVDNKYFSPEFLNRFDGVIVYQPLSQETLLIIAKKIIAKLTENYQKIHKVSLTVSDASLEELAKKGYHPEFGARNLERVISQEVEDRVAKKILEGSIKEGQTVFL